MRPGTGQFLVRVMPGLLVGRQTLRNGVMDCRVKPGNDLVGRGATLAGSTVTLWPRHTL